jgi:hypothetical protein
MRMELPRRLQSDEVTPFLRVDEEDSISDSE